MSEREREVPASEPSIGSEERAAVAGEREAVAGEREAVAGEREAVAGEREAVADQARERGARRAGTLALTLPSRLRVRLPLRAGVIGALGLGVFVAIAISPWLLPLVLPLCLALPFVALRLRAPREASLTWDGWGLVERAGGRVRTAIAWREARAKVVAQGAGRVVQVTDAAERAITVAEPAALPSWLGRRAAVAGSLDALVAACASLPEGPALRPDSRDARRPTMGPQVAWMTWGIALLGGVMMLLSDEMRRLSPAFLALMMALLFAAAALRPLHELLALFAEARRFDRAEKVTLDEAGGEGDEAEEHGDAQEARAKIRERMWLRIDLAPARHPDRRLAARSGETLFVTLPLAGWAASPSRVGITTVVPVEAAETEGERAEREALLRAVALELAARGLGALFWGALSLAPLLR